MEPGEYLPTNDGCFVPSCCSLIWHTIPVMRFLFPLMLIIYSPACRSQTWEWWVHLVNWDGVTPWQRYIKTMPKYLGPNGLPVPFLTNGSIDSINSFGLSGNFHFSRGDHT